MDPVRRHLRRHRVEQPAAHEPRRRLDRRGRRTRPATLVAAGRPAGLAGDAGRRCRRSACSRSRTARAASRPPARPRYLFDEVWGLPYSRRDARPTSPPAWPASTSSSSPTATRTTGSRRSARRASGPSATGSTPAAGSSPGRAARGRGQGRRLDGQARRLAHQRARARSSGSSLDAASPLAAGDRRPRLGHVPGRPDMQPGLGDGGRDLPGRRHARLRDVRPRHRRRQRWPARRPSSTRPSAPGGSSSFSIDPNFRAWTQGTQRMLWNAIVGPDPAGFGTRPRGRLEGAGGGREGGRGRAAERLPDLGSAIRIRVAGGRRGRDGEDPQPPRRRGRPRRRRRRRAVPRRQPRRPVVRRAPVVRARSSATSRRPGVTLRAASLP